MTGFDLLPHLLWALHFQTQTYLHFSDQTLVFFQPFSLILSHYASSSLRVHLSFAVFCPKLSESGNEFIKCVHEFCSYEFLSQNFLYFFLERAAKCSFPVKINSFVSYILILSSRKLLPCI